MKNEHLNKGTRIEMHPVSKVPEMGANYNGTCALSEWNVMDQF
jgi:hypothetical protein